MVWLLGMKVPVTLDWAGLCAHLEGCLFTVGCLQMFSRLQRFVILLGFWLTTCLWVSLMRLCQRKFVMKVNRRLLLSGEDTLSSMYFGIHLLQALVLQKTSIVKRAYCTERFYWGKIQRTCPVANEVPGFPIPVNRSGTEKMRDSPSLHWSFSEIYLPRTAFFHETDIHM